MHQKFQNFLHTHEGEVFSTVTGLPFTYELRAGGIYISRVKDVGDYTFTYDNIHNALDQIPLRSVADLKEVRGPSYCYAIIRKFLEMK